MIKKKEAEPFFRQFIDRLQSTGLAELLLFEADTILAHMHAVKSLPVENRQIPLSKYGRHDAEVVYRQLCNLMQHRTLYTNPGITRKQLAKLLNTNETYLYKIIYAREGLTFKVYIRNLRIAHARRMLEEITNPPHSIEEILRKSGFLSRATFYRQFKEVVGVTPDEYRRMSAEGKK